MKGKRVLVAPLDWGLGHATRCVPIIHSLHALKCEVLIAGSGQSLEFLKREFPDVQAFTLPGYNPVYPKSGSMMMKLAMQAGRFMRVVLAEHDAVKRIVANQKIELIISDNRYGCYSEKIPCVFITHQFNLRAPLGWSWLSFAANTTIKRFIDRFQQCWVPDYPGSVLTGELSKTKATNVRYIGPLSRLNRPAQDPILTNDVLALISGPEPQRSIFENLVTKQLVQSGLRARVVRGVIGNQSQKVSDTVKVTDHLDTASLQKIIGESRIILCRSGYSTIMDLAKLQKKAILVPTPGQTEQEYLANRFMTMGIAFTADQKSFSLPEALQASEHYSGFISYAFENLTSTLKKILEEDLF